MLLAVAATVALPLASVVACPADSVAEAPVPGAVNVTVAPLTGLPDASFTVACRGVANAVEIAVVCGVPPVA